MFSSIYCFPARSDICVVLSSINFTWKPKGPKYHRGFRCNVQKKLANVCKYGVFVFYYLKTIGIHGVFCSIGAENFVNSVVLIHPWSSGKPKKRVPPLVHTSKGRVESQLQLLYLLVQIQTIANSVVRA